MASGSSSRLAIPSSSRADSIPASVTSLELCFDFTVEHDGKKNANVKSADNAAYRQNLEDGLFPSKIIQSAVFVCIRSAATPGRA